MIDLSFRALFAHANGRPYAITTTFDGRDLVNGGMHMAVDVGNFGMDDPILSPITGRARGLYHFDTAIGIEYELGGGWTLQLWHLNATLAPGLAMTPGRSDIGDWVNVTRGQVCGRTGNSGALVNGQPMPAHTHIQLERAGQRYDVAPNLLGRPFDTAQEDDMTIPGKFLRHVQNRKAVLTSDSHFRAAGGTDDSLGVLPKGTVLYPVWVIASRVVGTAPDRAEWYGAAAYVGVKYQMGVVHSSVLPRTADGRGVALEAVEAADCSAQDNKLRGGRTAIDGAIQAHESAGRALHAAKEAVS
jgi:hypothetical protein